MKIRYLILAIFLTIGSQANAALNLNTLPYLDVVETKDGNVLKGMILEQVPNQYYKIEVYGGSVFIIKNENVIKIRKEKNPYYKNSDEIRANRRYKKTMTSAGIKSGFRLLLSPGTINFATDEDDAPGIGGTIFFGYETFVGNLGFRGGLDSSLVIWHDLYTEPEVLTLLAQGQIAYYFGHFSPYLTFGLGLDVELSYSDTSFAVEFGLGARYLVTKLIAIGLGVSFHPEVDKSISSIGLGVDLMFYF